MTLKAMRPVLFRSVQFETGDTLPADDGATVDAWLEAGSARWVEDEVPTKTPKAKRKTAPSGLAGKSSDGDPEALVGRIPGKPERKRSRKKT